MPMYVILFLYAFHDKFDKVIYQVIIEPWVLIKAIFDFKEFPQTIRS